VEVLQVGLQQFLGRNIEGGADGKYATHTLQAVQEAARKIIARGDKELTRQLADSGAFEGFAAEVFWTTIGLEWPYDFPLCLQLVMAFEGTGFSGAEGPKQTGDTAGVTWGAIGFTSFNGELQELLRALFNIAPQEFQELAFRTLPDKDRVTMYSVIAKEARNSAFGEWGLMSDGDVRPTLKNFLHALGELDWVRHEQMVWARDRFWLKAIEQAAALFANGADSRVPIRAKLLLFDVAVQNGGLKQEELDALKLMYRAQGELSERAKLLAVRDAVVARLAARKSKFTEDVSDRKTTICNGIGTVHGEEFKLGVWAL
jgi:hypothetical protein